MANEKNKRGLPEQLVELARKPGVIVGVHDWNGHYIDSAEVGY